MNLIRISFSSGSYIDSCLSSQTIHSMDVMPLKLIVITVMNSENMHINNINALALEDKKKSFLYNVLMISH